MSLIPMLVALSILVPAPMTKLEGWTGQIVMLKRSSIPFSAPATRGEPVSSGILMMIEYRVIQDKGEHLVVVENGKEVTVRKEDMVLQSDAVAYYSLLLEKDPNDVTSYAFRGWANKQLKSLENALLDYSKAIELAPNQCAWRNNRALIWLDKKEYDKAIADYDESIRLFPQYGLAYRNRSNCWLKKKEYANALKDLEKAAELSPEVPYVHNSLARLLATCPDEKIRDGKRALEAAQKANESMKSLNGAFLDTLAAVYAELGQFDEAVRYQEKAFTDPFFTKEKDKTDEARKRLQLYREKKPFREE